jgi:hypothetical protein
MDIEIDTTAFQAAMRKYAEAGEKEMPEVINKQFPKVFWEARKVATVADKGAIRSFAETDAAKYIALKHIKPDGRPMRVQVKEYVRKMRIRRLKAVGFTRLAIQGMALAASGKTPNKPTGPKFKARKATPSHHNASVTYSHTFKGGNRRKHIEEIASAVNQGMGKAVADMGVYIERKAKDVIRKAGL